MRRQVVCMQRATISYRGLVRRSFQPNVDLLAMLSHSRTSVAIATAAAVDSSTTMDCIKLMSVLGTHRAVVHTDGVGDGEAAARARQAAAGFQHAGGCAPREDSRGNGGVRKPPDLQQLHLRAPQVRQLSCALLRLAHRPISSQSGWFFRTPGTCQKPWQCTNALRQHLPDPGVATT